MTLEKAIELLKLAIILPPGVGNLDTTDAIQLGIEALERLQNVRVGNTIPGSLLPSEEPK